jgi:hypothetical protein
METEYKITFKKPEWNYWGGFAHIFLNYSDAEIELDRLICEGSSGIYRIIKISYEVVKQKESK